jgi:hypothetical protein
VYVFIGVRPVVLGKGKCVPEIFGEYNCPCQLFGPGGSPTMKLDARHAAKATTPVQNAFVVSKLEPIVADSGAPAKNILPRKLRPPLSVRLLMRQLLNDGRESVVMSPIKSPLGTVTNSFESVGKIFFQTKSVIAHLFDTTGMMWVIKQFASTRIK